MQVSRDRFISQFAISIMVRALKAWPRSSQVFPEHIPRAIYDTIRGTNAELPIGPQEFRVIVEPIVREIHRATLFDKRPDHDDLTGRVYDALSAAGVEVTIKPPIRSHGGAVGGR